MYLFFAILGYSILAAVGILDKFILTKTIHKPLVFVFYVTVLTAPLVFIIPFLNNIPTSASGWAAVVGAAIAFVLALILMYFAVSESEASHVGPLIGGAVPLFTVVMGASFLSEVLTVWQYIAIFILIAGSFLISLEQSRKHQGIHKGLLWGLGSGLFFAITAVVSKHIYDSYGFWSGLVLVRSMVGIIGLLLILFPDVRSAIFHRARQKHKSSSQKQIALVALDMFFGIIGVLFVQYAIARGSVSIVNALNGLQYALLVVGIAILSKFAPKLFKEEYKKGELRLELLAVAIIAVGLTMMLAK